MKKLIWSMSLFLFFAGCDEMPGTLRVTKKFLALVNGSTEEIGAGSYKTSLDFGTNQVTAKVEYSGQTLDVVISLPPTGSIPDNGPFAILSADSGQPFDVRGQVKTTTSTSALQTARESCQYYAQEPVCDSHGCTRRNVPKLGWHRIEFYEETVRKDLKFDIFESGRVSIANLKANFEGLATKTSRKITREDQCF